MVAGSSGEKTNTSRGGFTLLLMTLQLRGLSPAQVSSKALPLILYLSFYIQFLPEEPPNCSVSSLMEPATVVHRLNTDTCAHALTAPALAELGNTKAVCVTPSQPIPSQNQRPWIWHLCAPTK